MPARTAGPSGPAKDDAAGSAAASPGELPQRQRIRQPFEPVARSFRPGRGTVGPGNAFQRLPPRALVREPFEPAAGSLEGRGWPGLGPEGPADDAGGTPAGPLFALRSLGPAGSRIPPAVSAGAGAPRERLRQASPRSRMTVAGATAAVAVAAAGAVIAGSLGMARGSTGQPAAAPGQVAPGVPEDAPASQSSAGPDGVSGPATSGGRVSLPAAGGGRRAAADSAAQGRPGSPSSGHGQPEVGASPPSAAPAAPPAGADSPPASSPASSPASAPAAASATATPVTGSVTCTSGAAVVGVWVQAAATGSGWATLAAAGSAMAYSYTLPEAESYSLHVGCGGTAASWKIAVYGPFELGTDNSFACDDVPGSTGYKACVGLPLRPVALSVIDRPLTAQLFTLGAPARDGERRVETTAIRC